MFAGPETITNSYIDYCSFLTNKSSVREDRALYIKPVVFPFSHSSLLPGIEAVHHEYPYMAQY